MDPSDDLLSNGAQTGENQPAMDIDWSPSRGQQPISRMASPSVAFDYFRRETPPPLPDLLTPGQDESTRRPQSDDDYTPQRWNRRGAPPRRLAASRSQQEAEVDSEMEVVRTRPASPLSPQAIAAIRSFLAHNQRFDDTDSDKTLVDEVLAQSQSVVDGPPTRKRSSAEDLVDEIAHSVDVASLMENHCERTKQFLDEQVSEGYLHTVMKIKALRSQYRKLNREWDDYCADLDRQINSEKEQKTPAPPTPLVETPGAYGGGFFVAPRATRRTAANIGLMADAVRSDLEFEQVMQSLGNEDLVDPNVLSIRNAANIPDMVSVLPRSAQVMSVRYDDTNGVVAYPEEFYNIGALLGDWTDLEKAVFTEQFAIAGKQFGKIAEHLPHKTAEQCVLFYYVSKGTLVNFKDVASRGVRGRRKRALGGRRSAPALGRQKGNALLTDIRTRMGDGTPGESPNNSPKQNETDLPAKRRRNGDYLEDGPRTRPGRSTRTRRHSPESDGARDSEGDQSSSENASDMAEVNGTDGRRGAVRRARKPPSTVESASAPAKKRPSSHWSIAEKAAFKEQLAIYGTDWEPLSAAIKTKSPTQCKNFYYSNRADMDLERIAAEVNGRRRDPWTNYVSILGQTPAHDLTCRVKSAPSHITGARDSMHSSDQAALKQEEGDGRPSLGNGTAQYSFTWPPSPTHPRRTDDYEPPRSPTRVWYPGPAERDNNSQPWDVAPPQQATAQAYDTRG